MLLAFYKGPRSIRTHTNSFVVNLAISDLMVGCLSVPFWMCVKLKVVDATFSQYFVSLDVLFGATSIFSLVAISIERMAAVRYATLHYNMSNKPVIGSIMVTWFIGFILFGLKIYLGEKGLYEFTITIFVVSFILPLSIILCSYIMIFKSAHNLRKADNQTRAQSIHRDLHIAKTICIIIGLFFVCWAPFFMMNLLFVTCFSCLKVEQFILWVTIAKIMHYSNSMMNFFVYAVRSPEFKKTFKALAFHGCSIAHLRQRSRTMSIMSRKRGASITRRNNNADSFRDLEKNENGRSKEAKSLLAVPAINGGQNSVNSETFLTECDNHILYPYPS